MKTTTRKEALEKRLTLYYTGVPCKQGHDCSRYTSTHSCVECLKSVDKTTRARYRERNRQKIRQRAQRWRENNREHVRRKLKQWHDQNPHATDYKNNEKYRNQRIAISRRFRKNNPIKALLINKRAWCKRLQVDFDLREEDIKVPKVCPVLGIPLIWGGGIKSDNCPSLDRIVPNGGYVKDNVRVISWRANNLKSNGTIKEFESILEYLHENIKRH